jgi:hypothetical protein
MVFAGSLDDRHQNVLPSGLRVHAFCGGGAARKRANRRSHMLCRYRHIEAVFDF